MPKDGYVAAMAFSMLSGLNLWRLPPWSVQKCKKLIMGYIGGNIGIMENKMETTIMGYMG